MKKTILFLLSAVFLSACSQSANDNLQLSPQSGVGVPAGTVKESVNDTVKDAVPVPGSDPTVLEQKGEVPAEAKTSALVAEASTRSTILFSDRTYSFEYSSDLKLDAKVELMSGKGQTLTGLEAFQPKTNLTSAKIEISSDVEYSCRDFSVWGKAIGKSEKKLINNWPFDVNRFSDAGMSQINDVVLYSTVYNKKCYKLALIMRSGALPGAYENPPKAFDEQRIEDLFVKVANSFKFL